MSHPQRAAIEAALKAIGASAPVFLSKAGPDRLFEAYVLSCLLQALKKIGADCQVYSGTGAPSLTLNLKRAPGQIYGNAADFGFIMVRYGTEFYELHTDLRVAGNSKILHELDICILEHPHADTCRTQRVDPNGSKVRLLCECKCYGKALPLRIGREFLGLCSEFHAEIRTIASNSGSASILSLLRSHRRVTQFSLSPSNPGHVELFIGWLAKELQHAL